MVNVEELKRLYEAKPFRPFEIILDDGTRIVIPTPEVVGWSADARTLAFPLGMDAIDWVDFARVSIIRQIKGSTPARKKGSRG